MSVFNDNYAYNHAINIVVAGLQSGSIKLLGPNHSSPANAQKDADYLNHLIKSIGDNLTAK